jgi:hypothetical protein
MPVPAFRYPGLLQPVPREAQPPVRAFPFGMEGGGLLEQALRARRFQKEMGGGGGMLDITPYRLPLGQRPATVPPPGLLQPVVLDRIRKGLLGTEGMARPYGGGGRTTSVPTAGSRPPYVDWSYSENSGTFSTRTPAGVYISARPTFYRGGREGYDVEFSMPRGTFHGTKGQYAKGEEGMSIKRALQHFGEVFKATKEFVKKANPDHISFAGASRAHSKIYDKVAPDLAEALGGKLKVGGTKELRTYQIDLPPLVKAK